MNIVTLIEELVNGLIAAEDIFFQNPKDFYSLEKSVKSTTEAFSAAFLGNVLTSMNEKIYEDRWRKTRYTAQRTDKRMLISSVGDITLSVGRDTGTRYKGKIYGRSRGGTTDRSDENKLQ